MAESKPQERPEWAHEYMRYAGSGDWICDGCPLESCDCSDYEQWVGETISVNKEED